MIDNTIVALLSTAFAKLEDARAEVGGGEAAREFSLAITAVEDAIMRANRGFAKKGGFFKVADVQAAS